MTELAELVERLRAAVTPDAHEARMKGWDYARKHVIDGDMGSHPRDIIESEFAELEEYVSEAVAAIERLEREVERCHARLEIDHYWRMGDNDDSDLERVDIPLDEREAFPDGIEARDATISFLEADLAASQAEVIRLKEALRKMHRRAQSAEGQAGAARYELEMWASHPVMKTVGGYLAREVAKSGLKGLNRRARSVLEEQKP